MLLQIFGLVSKPSWWHLSRIPSGGGTELAAVLAKALPGAQAVEFFCDETELISLDTQGLAQRWYDGVGQLIAKPVGAQPRHHPDSRLYLVSTTGPDAGRSFPLTRRNLSVGRNDSRAQLRDPWLSSHDFSIRLSSSGTVISPVGDRDFLWESGDAHEAGATRFALHRGPGQALVTPKSPGLFEIKPGQPPSPPNVVLQVIGAAAPLLIGIVLMVVTGMWYFLLFSGISVLIAVVMITQYRRARHRFISEIRQSLAETADRFRRCVFGPDQLTRALSSRSNDPLSLCGPQPEHPVVHLGSGQRKASMEQIQQTRRWDDYLTGQVPVVLTLQPGHCTVVVGNPGALRPVKNWCLAQLFRHAKATGTGLNIEGEHVAGPPVVMISDAIDATTELPQLIFTTTQINPADHDTTIVDLTSHTVEGSITATDLEPLGISSWTLSQFSEEISLNRPEDHLSMEQLTLSTTTMQAEATDELTTTIGTGPLGLTINLVADGPHLLITGTTGSGKSELVLTVLVGMIERYPPTEVSMILLDFKGGSSFNVLAPLPHTMSVETNHIAAASFRSLDAIAAELYRRELLFAEYQVADYQAFRRAVPHIVLPRLIVAIDELRVLVDDNPEAAEALARLAATGRSLGFHLITATQRTQGAVSADIRANIGSIISLRTATEHDSWEVLGTGQAFRISPETPGRAYFKAGAEQPRLFQTARYMLDDEPLVLLPHDAGVQDQLELTTHWSALVEQLCARAAPLPVSDPVILPELPNQLRGDMLTSQFAWDERLHAVLGLVDDPGNCAQYPLVLGPASPQQNVAILSNSVAWVGTSSSGIEIAAKVVTGNVLKQDGNTVFLDGGRLASEDSSWDHYLHVADAQPDVLKQLTQWLQEVLANQQNTTVVITDWGSWSTQMVTGSFQGFEDVLIQLLRQYASLLKLYVFGSRELAGGRMIAMIPDRLYLPTNSSPEHRMIWPKLVSVPAVEGRAVLVTSAHAAGGLAVQLRHDTL